MRATVCPPCSNVWHASMGPEGDLWTVWKHRWDPRTTESVGEHPVVPRNGARAPWGGRIWRASECDLRRAEGRQSTLAYNKQSRTSNPPIPFLSGMKSARGIENEAGGGTDQVSLCFTTCFSHHLKISFSLHLFLLSSTFFTFSTQSWTRHVYPILFDPIPFNPIPFDPMHGVPSNIMLNFCISICH